MAEQQELVVHGQGHRQPCNQLHELRGSDTGDSRVSFYLAAARAPATAKAYADDLRHFIAHAGSIPASVADVLRYLAACSHLAVSTLRRRLAGIADAHAALGVTDPTKGPLVRKLMRGIARVHGAPIAGATPLWGADLQRMMSMIPDDLPGVRDKAVLLVGFACALRRSELAGIRVADLVLRERDAAIRIRIGKTDQLAHGSHHGVPRLRGTLCPVAALETWLAKARITEGPVFRSINRWGHVSETGISGETVRAIVRQRGARANICLDRLSAHSLRSGFAVSGLKAGMSLPAVRAVTRHKTLAGIAPYVLEAAPPSAASMIALLEVEA